MATWFNLRLITAEIPDRHYRAGPLALFSAELFTAGGRQLTVCKRAASLAGALTLIAELGMFRAPEPTVKLHRGRLMQKMGAETLADLIRMAEKLRDPKTP